MKEVPVVEAQPQLRELITRACRGELIVLTDGEKQVSLESHVRLDIEEDSPELEAELFKAIDGPFAPYSAEELKAIGDLSVCSSFIALKRVAFRRFG